MTGLRSAKAATAAQAGEVLIIRHGALGDLVQSLGPIQAVRAYHADARITLLTSPPFQEFMEACPWVDRVWLDARPKWHHLRQGWDLVKCLRGGGFERVYDLQTSGRSSFYRRIFALGPQPEWSGIAGGASHPHANPERNSMHTLDRQRDQLGYAGIHNVPAPDLSWAVAEGRKFTLPESFALLVPGGSAHRPDKRWPAEHFAALADLLSARQVTPVLIGGKAERDLAREVAARAAGTAIDLTGHTDLFDLAALAAGARVVVGNDTGPTHVAAVAGAPTVALFSAASDPALCAPRGPAVAVLRQERLADLLPQDVFARAEALQSDIAANSSTP